MHGRSVSDAVFAALNLVLVLLLAAMIVMVFGNAALRKLSDYGLVLFGGGIQVSEELSRVFFVWLIFIGAVVVTRENGHLGVETLVAALGARGRAVCMGITDALVVACCAVLFWGTWRQAPIHVGNIAPITGMSMIWVYGFGFVASLGIGGLSLLRLVRVATGRVGAAELARFAGQYDDDPARAERHAD